jgi:hypothetical protein
MSCSDLDMCLYGILNEYRQIVKSVTSIPDSYMPEP